MDTEVQAGAVGLFQCTQNPWDTALVTSAFPEP